MDVETVRWLLTDEGQRVLAQASSVAGDPLEAGEQLRRTSPSVDAGRLAAALTQAELRRRATAKFGALAASMYFTPDGLEQATRLAVAEHRAARLVAFETASVIDLGCGIGGDLVAFARAGLTAAGVDLD